MNLTFRGRPITKHRLGWWLRIGLTRLFGSRIYVTGRNDPLKIFPWVWCGKILLMGAEHEFLQADFTNQYTLRLRSSPVVSSPERKSFLTGNRQRQASIAHIILGHQNAEEIKIINDHAKTLGPSYKHLLAYGGSCEQYQKISFEDKVFIKCQSLRGPSHLMSHYEILTAARDFFRRTFDEPDYYVFSESDLLPVKADYLDEIVQQMNVFQADFGGKCIRDITGGNCLFYSTAVGADLVGPTANNPELGQTKYFHCIGCFFAVSKKIIDAMIKQCEKTKGLYFEVMFPTAAYAAGGQLLSIDTNSDILETVRYRPFYSIDDIIALQETKCTLVHPVKGDTLLKAIKNRLINKL